MKRQIWYLAGTIFSLTLAPLSAMADQPAPEYKERVPVAAETAAPREELEVCNWRTRLSPGVATYFFTEEDTLAAPALHFDVWNTETPLNYRVGIEGRHMHLGQDGAEDYQEFSDKTTNITFIRIPFALEYIMPVDENFTLYLGGGPDLIRTANDLSDFTVGGHLGARMQYDIDEKWGLAVEAGYFWAEVDDGGSDMELDAAYITPLVTYTF